MRKATSPVAWIGLLVLTPLVVAWALFLNAIGRDRLLKDLEYMLWGFE